MTKLIDLASKKEVNGIVRHKEYKEKFNIHGKRRFKLMDGNAITIGKNY